MKLEDHGKCAICNYGTLNKKSLSNHLRYGCTFGKNWHKQDYKKRPDYYKEKSKANYELNSDNINEKRRLRYSLNPEKEKQRIMEYVKTEKGKAVRKSVWHRYRTEKIKGDVSSEQIEKLFKKQLNCKRCNSQDHLEIDHIMPLSKGGKHEIDNLQLLCRKCNRSKGNKIWN